MLVIVTTMRLLLRLVVCYTVLTVLYILMQFIIQTNIYTVRTLKGTHKAFGNVLMKKFGDKKIPAALGLLLPMI